MSQSRRAHRGPLLMMAWCGAWLTACTEPNPYLDAATESTSTGEASSSSSTTEPEPGSTSGTTTTATTTTGEDESSTAMPPLGCADMGMECVPAPPEGFAGPFAWLAHELDAGAPPSCPAPFDQLLVEAFSNVSAPAAGCGCACGSFTGANCNGTATMEHHDVAACAGAPDLSQNLGPGCNPVPVGWSGGSLFFDAPPMAGGGCNAMANVDLDPAVFLSGHLGCAGTFEAGSCGAGELCAPMPSDPLAPRWCVWQEGDVGCPEGPYSERTLLHQGIDDTRGCEPCTCAKPTGPCMNAVVLTSPNMDCSMTPGGLAADTCQASGLVSSLLYSPGTPAGSCTPATVVPTGDAAGSEPVTFCCTP